MNYLSASFQRPFCTMECDKALRIICYYSYVVYIFVTKLVICIQADANIQTCASSIYDTKW